MRIKRYSEVITGESEEVNQEQEREKPVGKIDFKTFMEETDRLYRRRTDLHFDRQGRHISFMEYLRLSDDFSYKVIRQDMLPGGVFFSTVWLGVDYNFSMRPPPLIFESMIFRAGKGVRAALYTTEDQAITGHLAILSSLLLEQKYNNQLTEGEREK